MNLNETIEAFDIALALEGESGKFEVIAPTGDRYVVDARPGHSIASFRPLNLPANQVTGWRITKVANLPTSGRGRKGE